jgi:hypothetical protein
MKSSRGSAFLDSQLSSKDSQLCFVPCQRLTGIAALDDWRGKLPRMIKDSNKTAAGITIRGLQERPHHKHHTMQPQVTNALLKR